jgi:hypothetical protein
MAWIDHWVHTRNFPQELLDLVRTTNESNTDNCPPGESAPYPSFESPPEIRNFSYPFDDRYLPTWEVAVKATFYAIPMAMATFGNIIVLITIAFNKRLQSPTYLYIANLAISDLVVGAFNMWMHLVPNVIPSWPLGDTLCEISIFIRRKLCVQFIRICGNGAVSFSCCGDGERLLPHRHRGRTLLLHRDAHQGSLCSSTCSRRRHDLHLDRSYPCRLP